MMMPYWRRYMMSLCDGMKDYPHFVQGIKYYRTVLFNTVLTFSFLTFITRSYKSELELLDGLSRRMTAMEYNNL